MKITKRQLRRIIQESLNEALPPHLQKHFRADGSSIHEPGWKDVTPAGYGPDNEDPYAEEEWDEDEPNTSHTPEVQAIDDLLQADAGSSELVTDDVVPSFVVGPIKKGKMDGSPVRVWSNNDMGMLKHEVHVDSEGYDEEGNAHPSEQLVQWLKAQGAKVRA